MRKLFIVIAGSFIPYAAAISDDHRYDKDEILAWERRMAEDTICRKVSVFVARHYPDSDIDGYYLAEKCLEYGVPPAFAIAQAHIESHFGKHGWAKQTNSVWNMGAYDNQRPITWYDSADSSIVPYLKTLKRDYLLNRTVDELLLNFVNVNGHRYASTPSYERELSFQYRHTQNILDTLKF